MSFEELFEKAKKDLPSIKGTFCGPSPEYDFIKKSYEENTIPKKYKVKTYEVVIHTEDRDNPVEHRTMLRILDGCYYIEIML